MAATQGTLSRDKRRRLAMRWGKKFLRVIGRFQARHSLVSVTPVLDHVEFPWVGELEAAWPGIRRELDQILEHPEDLPPFHVMSPDQARISKGDHWKTFGFYVYGNRVDDNCQQCPYTVGVLEKLPGMRTAFFSVLDAGSRYPRPQKNGPRVDHEYSPLTHSLRVRMTDAAALLVDGLGPSMPSRMGDVPSSSFPEPRLPTY